MPEIQGGTIRLDFETAVLERSVEDRTVSFLACREVEIPRFDWFKNEEYLLTLGHKPSEVRLERVKAGQCMFLSHHTGGSVPPVRLGKVIDAKLENGELHTVHRINKTTHGQQYLEGEVEARAEPGVSIEAVVYKAEVLQKAKYKTDENGQRQLVSPLKLRATDWELLAVSNADINAVPGAVAQRASQEEALHSIQLSAETGYEFVYQDTEEQPTVDKEQLERLQADYSTAQNELKQLRESNRKLSLEKQYYQLRSVGLQHVALTNRITEDEFVEEFGEPLEDIKKLELMSSEDAAIELKFLGRTLEKMSKRDPIDRVRPKDRAKLQSETIVSRSVDGDPGKRESLSETPTGEPADDFATRLVANLGVVGV